MITKLLIANRGEIAIRIARAAADLGIATVAVYSIDDARSLHVRTANKSHPLEGTGVAAYLDMEQLIAIARKMDCDAIHPGYGFLSENVSFARRCLEAGLTFIGPGPDLLQLFGDKIEARSLARRCDVPLLPGTEGPTSLEEARAFFSSLGPDAAIMIKAIMGGGGRGMRPVYNLAELDEAYARCQSEACTAFGLGDVYVEQLLRKPRHIEVQVIGDGTQVIHLGERDCTMQRRNQKLIEIAPCPTLSSKLRDKITNAALRLVQSVNYRSLGTIEFLIEGESEGEATFAFLEANPRLQVEHTVTEAVTGIDLVKTQIAIAAGKSLADLGLTENAPRPRYYAMQMRINMETINSTGGANPTGGTLSVYEVPSGPDIRVDGYGYASYKSTPAFDSLLAKLIVTSRSPRYEDVVSKAYRALSEFRIEGIATNIPFLLNLLRRPEVVENNFHTRFIEENANELTSSSEASKESFFEDGSTELQPAAANVKIAPEGAISVKAPIMGRIIEVNVIQGDPVAAGQTVAVMEAMKMECEVKSDRNGYVRSVCVEIDDVISEGDPLLFLEEAAGVVFSTTDDDEIDFDAIRPSFDEMVKRHSFVLDEKRPEAVARRHRKNQRTARENVENLCDEGSFIEYGALAVAAQRTRRSEEDLIARTPADGLITGLGSVNGSLFGKEKSRCLVMAYDYTVLAGTQGFFNHKKKDRMLKIAHKHCLPIIIFAEGGGGRPGDVDVDGVAIAGLDNSTFAMFGGYSGKAPLIGIVSGPCFAGNAALLGCCDVIIATKNANIGMGGPVMIEGGGLGVFRPEEVGPVDVQTKNGVVDIAVEDDVEAVAVAKQYLSYFQGATTSWEAPDQNRLRTLVPENRRRIYDMRTVIKTLADVDSFLELRSDFGSSMITGFIRIEGQPFGLIANDCKCQAGAIEAEGADKATRLMQICNAHGLPILSLCDTPGFMVGPNIEARAQVRHVCRMFVVGPHLSVPYFTVVTRKAYGLGAQAMAKGGFHESMFITAWPTGEFGAMGLEGAVKKGFEKQLNAIENPQEREALFNQLLDQMYERGKAINMASYLEIDSVIDPADTRKWLMLGLTSASVQSRKAAGHSFIDPW
jgi:acetyl/propionyl-CoA carboxylase alpha subunit